MRTPFLSKTFLAAESEVCSNLRCISRNRVTVEVRFSRLISFYLDEPDINQAITLHGCNTEYRRRIPNKNFSAEASNREVFHVFFRWIRPGGHPFAPRAGDPHVGAQQPPYRSTEACWKMISDYLIDMDSNSRLSTGRGNW